MTAACRLAAAVVGVLSLLAIAPPASAAEPLVKWTRPSLDENVLRQPGAVSGTITGEEDHTITGASFEIVADPPVEGPADPCAVEPIDNIVYDGVNRTESFEIDVKFPCNGVYELVATIDYEEPLVDAVGPVTMTPKTIETRPLRFSVAIPPAPVQALEASYDQASKEVGLTWAPNSEVDLLGYFVERNPSGPEGFSRITPGLLGADMTSFTDPGIEEENRYQVVAVRRGAQPDSQLAGDPSSWVAAGPERPEPTLPDLPPPNSGAPSDPGGSSGDGGNTTRRPAPPSRSRSNSNIFEETLPFDPSRTTIAPADTAPPEDAAVVAEFDDASSDDDRRATLVPIAGGLALVVGAMHLFLLSKRAGEPPDIPMSSR